MKYLIKAFDKKTKTLYQIQSDDLKIIEDKALLYKAQGLDYKIYHYYPVIGYREIKLTGDGGYALVI